MYQLREIEECDLTHINRWRNDPSMIDLLGTAFRYINLDVDKDWYNVYMNNRHSNVRCAIIDKDKTDSIVGAVYLTNIDYVFRSCVSSIMIGDPSYRGKGVGMFALHSLLQHAFFNLNLHRVECDILKYNEASVMLHEKLGYRREGLLREAVYKNGQYHDLIHMGILKPDFMNLCENMSL